MSGKQQTNSVVLSVRKKVPY